MKHRSYKLSRNLKKSRTLVHQRRVNKKRMSKCPRRRQPVARRKKILLSKRLRLKRRNQDGRRRPTRRNQMPPKSRWNANFSSFLKICIIIISFCFRTKRKPLIPTFLSPSFPANSQLILPFLKSVYWTPNRLTKKLSRLSVTSAHIVANKNWCVSNCVCRMLFWSFEYGKVVFPIVKVSTF